MSPETLLQLATLVLLIPLAGFAILIFFSKRLPRRGDWLETGLLFVGLALSVVIFAVKLGTYHDETLQANFTWANFGTVPGFGPMKVTLGIMLDNLAVIMLVAVYIVSAFVHLFSIGYMHGDVRYGRYFAYLGLFTFSMLGIVITNNFFLMYVFWELVGLSSYLLIGHWFEKKSASDAAKKAFIVNRVGDIGMFTGILILFGTFQTFGFDAIFSSIKTGNIPFGSEAWLTAGHSYFLLSDRQIRSVPASCLVARCDGGSDAGQRADPRRNDGRGGGLSGCPHVPDDDGRCAPGHCLHRGHHGVYLCDDRYCTE